MERRQPWMKFYWDDWRSDPNLRASSLAARGLWADMIGMMRAGTPYGYLTLNGHPLSLGELAAQVGRPLREVKAAFDELGVKNVYSVDQAGLVFCRRMVRDAQKSAVHSENGRRGGETLWQGLRPPLKPSPQPWPSNPPEQIVESTPEARSQNPLPPGGIGVSAEIAERAGRFLDAYPEVYRRVRNAYYPLKPVRDYHYACQLVAGWPHTDRLLDMLEVFLRLPRNPKNTPGTPGQFLHMAPEVDSLLRENGR